MRTVLISTVEFFWSNFLMWGEHYIINIHFYVFSRLFFYLSNTRAQCLFSEWSCSWVIWFDVYGSFHSHELTFSVMQQLCNTPASLLSRRYFLMQLSSSNCNSCFGRGKKIAVREKGCFLAWFPKATGVKQLRPICVHWPFSLNSFWIHWFVLITFDSRLPLTHSWQTEQRWVGAVWEDGDIEVYRERGWST